MQKHIVDDPAVICIQRPHSEGFAAGFHSFGDLQHLFLEPMLLFGAEVLAIDPDPPGLRILVTEDLIDHVLEVIEPVAIATGDALRIAAVDLQAWAVCGFLEFDFHCESKMAEQAIQDPFCRFRRRHNAKVAATPAGSITGGG